MRTNTRYKEVDLPFLVVNDGIIIARFENSVDRNHCLSDLEDRFKDCKFIAIEEK